MTWNYFKLSAYSMHQIEGWRGVFYDVLFYCNNLTHWIKLWWQLFCIFDKRKHWTLFGLWILVQLNLLFGDCVLCWMFGDKKLPAVCKCNNWVVISTHHFTSLKWIIVLKKMLDQKEIVLCRFWSIFSGRILLCGPFCCEC